MPAPPPKRRAARRPASSPAGPPPPAATPPTGAPADAGAPAPLPSAIPFPTRRVAPPAAPDAPDAADAHFAPTEPPPLPLPLRPDASLRPDAADAAGIAAADEALAEAQAFAFLADPPADPRWRHPGVRAALAVAAALLALALAAQAALHWRDVLAAARPGLRPALDALCLAAGCRVGPLRRLEGVSVEGSEWLPSPSGDAARLVLVLRNAGELPVALPWVELTLTEVNGRLLARRALAPADFGATSATLAPASETVLEATLAVDGPPPAGYTVELFHP